MVSLKNKIHKLISNTINWIQYPIMEMVYNRKCICVYGLFEKYGFWLKPNNIGDDLNIPFIEVMSGKKVVKADYSFRVRSGKSVSYSFIGSILEKVCSKGHSSVVWGSGFKFSQNDLDDDSIIRNKYLAVRGPKTRDIILARGGECPAIYGDPVILISKYINIKVEKKFKIGLIPHKLELKSPIVRELQKDNGTHLIDVTCYKHWKNVLEEINECEVILSSSLHGLIIADSYKIPNLWVRFTDYTDGGGFKYEDYYGGICREPKCLDLSLGVDLELIKRELKKWTPPFINPEFEKSSPF